MRKELVDLHQEYRRTTFFVTHDQIEAMTLGERICVLNQGRIEQIGTPLEIYDAPENLFVARFFGMPSINLIHGKSKLIPKIAPVIFIAKIHLSCVSGFLPSIESNSRISYLESDRRKFKSLKKTPRIVLKFSILNTTEIHRLSLFKTKASR